MDIYKEMRDILFENGISSDSNSFGDEYFTDDIFNILKTNIRNHKGEDFTSRFRDIISDPNNLFIKRCESSGKLENDIVTLHNGIRVYNRCYYDKFSDILILNKGVHEPSEERAFDKVLSFMRDDSVMIELGCYWSFYSIWFLKDVKNGKTFCIDSDDDCLLSGKNNFKLNGLEGDFTKAFIGYNGLNLLDYISEKSIEYIDILHSDIQGYEFEMLNQIKPILFESKVKYIFLSTHSNEIHKNCLNLLRECNYKILCSCDYDNESFQFDGFILSCPEDIAEIESFDIGSREYSRLISSDRFNKILKSKND